jgi:hypothetical protein
VTFDAGDDCGLEISFDPPVLGPLDVTFGARVEVEETIRVPLDLPSATTSIDCGVRIFADRVLLGIQHIHVDIDCTSLSFEGLANGHRVNPDDFAGQGVTISSAGANAGAALFDSRVGGPNDPGLDTDLLIGHGNLLLLQDDAHASLSGPGTFATPVDDPQGGDLVFDFAPPIDPRSVLLTDLDPPPNAGASVTLLDGAGRQRVYAVPPGWTGNYGVSGFRLLDLGTLAAQPGAGPRFATASEDPGFQQADVIRVVVHMTGLGRWTSWRSAGESVSKKPAPERRGLFLLTLESAGRESSRAQKHATMDRVTPGARVCRRGCSSHAQLELLQALDAVAQARGSSKRSSLAAWRMSSRRRASSARSVSASQPLSAGAAASSSSSSSSGPL